MENCLKSVTIRGYKTIRELENFEPGPLTVLIGPNGAGKSNFISFFQMLSRMLAPPGNLQVYVAEQGGASALLHDGSSKTKEIDCELELAGTQSKYSFQLALAGGDSLYYAKEAFIIPVMHLPSRDSILDIFELGSGHRESRLVLSEDTLRLCGPTALLEGNKLKSAEFGKIMLYLLRAVNVFQFHNTSASARIRSKWNMHDGRWLKEDAANIAPFLRRLRESEPGYYQRIVDAIRLIIPFFADFQLEPEYNSLLLCWREHKSDRVFNVSQASDGMLRVMALVALLLQPQKDLPRVLILDEPELGLHPHAISIIAGLIKSASLNTQVIVATQSAALVDYFDPEDIVVVEREGRESLFTRLNPDALGDWLKEYSLSELWEKNVIGGRPA
ncbi:MAG TPA: AAA family ATPase [Candidatus Brocadiia bacterium]|nr:AAA family ATPase [Candidatus Brocadiia bacterium]